MHHAGRKNCGQIHNDAGRTAFLLFGKNEARKNSGAAPIAGGAYFRTGAAVRLLLQRPNHQRRRTAVQEPAALRSPNPICNERPLMPLRNLSSDSVGDSTRLESDRGGDSWITRTVVQYSHAV